ncbi:hypothetical protein XELAEV_18001719mg [Xenopus laevis]|nr:hypothetical protein XELAEV_18001719mg [Xenopus laevis]
MYEVTGNVPLVWFFRIDKTISKAGKGASLRSSRTGSVKRDIACWPKMDCPGPCALHCMLVESELPSLY